MGGSQGARRRQHHERRKGNCLKVGERVYSLRYDILQIRDHAKADQPTSMLPLSGIGKGLRENVSGHFVASLIQDVHVVMRQSLSQPRDGYTMSASDVAQRRVLAGAHNL